jgi:hypothetical protein
MLVTGERNKGICQTTLLAKKGTIESNDVLLHNIISAPYALFEVVGHCKGEKLRNEEKTKLLGPTFFFGDTQVR